MQIDKNVKVLRSFLKNIFNTFYKSGLDFIHNKGLVFSGNLAFLLIFSLFPFIIFLTFILGMIGETTLGTQFLEIFRNSLPADTVETIIPRVKEIINSPSPRILSLAFVSIIWTASSFVEGLRDALNMVYRVKDKPNYFLGRIFSILQFCVITFIIIASVFGLVITPQIINQLNALIPEEFGEVSLLWLNTSGFLMYLILFIMVSLIYYMVPNKKQKIEFVLPGALLVVVGWVVSGKLFSLYLRNDNFNQFNLVYGSLEGIIVTLIFFYMITIILVYGAEFNYHFGENFLTRFIKRVKNLRIPLKTK